MSSHFAEGTIKRKSLGNGGSEVLRSAIPSVGFVRNMGNCDSATKPRDNMTIKMSLPFKVYYVVGKNLSYPNQFYGWSSQLMTL